MYMSCQLTIKVLAVLVFNIESLRSCVVMHFVRGVPLDVRVNDSDHLPADTGDVRLHLSLV